LEDDEELLGRDGVMKAYVGAHQVGWSMGLELGAISMHRMLLCQQLTTAILQLDRKE
jgi:hypothetical protein